MAFSIVNGKYRTLPVSVNGHIVLLLLGYGLSSLQGGERHDSISDTNPFVVLGELASHDSYFEIAKYGWFESVALNPG